MAHQIEENKRMVWSVRGGTPWHKLGVAIDDDKIFDLDYCMEQGELNTHVERTDLYIKVDNKFVNISNLGKGILRVEDNKPLAVVGPRFTPLQNKEAFDFFRPWVEEKMAYLESAGSLNNGRRMWVLAEINLPNLEVVKDDQIARFVLLSNSHDGSLAVRLGFTDIRTICANTLAQAHNSTASKLIRVRHSKSVKQKVENLRDIMNLANQEFETTAEKYRFLSSKSYNQNDVNKFVKKMFSVENTPIVDISTKTKNQMNRVFDLIETGQGNNLPGVKGTLWGIYNGFTSYLSHERGNTPSTRLNSLWFGDSAIKNKQALETLLSLAV